MRGREENADFGTFTFPFLFIGGERDKDMLENKFQSKLIKELKEMFPGCIVMKNDASYIQGIPDLLILYKNKWASLEVKKSANAKRQPNQEYYVDQMNEMSFSSFICPENKEVVLSELCEAFKS